LAGNRYQTVANRYLSELFCPFWGSFCAAAKAFFGGIWAILAILCGFPVSGGMSRLSHSAPGRRGAKAGPPPPPGQDAMVSVLAVSLKRVGRKPAQPTELSIDGSPNQGFCFSSRSTDGV